MFVIIDVNTKIVILNQTSHYQDRSLNIALFINWMVWLMLKTIGVVYYIAEYKDIRRRMANTTVPAALH